MLNLKARLETIRTANGYATDIGANVHEWRVAPIADSELPLLNLQDSDSDHDHVAAMGGVEHRLSVDCEVYAGTISALRDAMNDVMVCLSGDRRLSGEVETIEFSSSHVEASQKETKLFAAVLPLRITYRTVGWGM